MLALFTTAHAIAAKTVAIVVKMENVVVVDQHVFAKKETIFIVPAKIVSASRNKVRSA